MKEYTNYILKTLTVLDAFFEELDKFVKEFKTTKHKKDFNDKKEHLNNEIKKQETR